jgi:spore germination cell wall hydrolase CwlJ-like protein
MNEAQAIANALFSETKDVEDAKNIASVIINRTKNPKRWGATPTDVIFQPQQFSGVGGSEWSKAETQNFTEKEANIYKQFLQIGYQVSSGNFETTTEANHYFNPKIVKPKWAEKMKKVGENKYHSYYKD